MTRVNSLILIGGLLICCLLPSCIMTDANRLIWASERERATDALNRAVYAASVKTILQTAERMNQMNRQENDRTEADIKTGNYEVHLKGFTGSEVQGILNNLK